MTVVQRGGSSRGFITVVLLMALVGCSRSAEQAAPAATAAKPVDVQHAGITTPHGDHSPHHGGMVMMNGDMHFEVVLDPGGRHRVWFSDAVREDLPASLASKVAMTVARPGQAPEAIALQIDDSGESWVAAGKPIAGKDVMVTLTFVTGGEPFEIEIPFVAP